MEKIIPISLDGEWMLRWVEDEQPDPAEFPSGLEAIPAIPVRVPGNVELDLQRAGLLPEPFFSQNILELNGLEKRDWWYSKRFNVPEEYSTVRSELVFEGLDTLATVWLNRQCIGQSENMLIPQHFETTKMLLPGTENNLVVHLRSATAAARQMNYEPGMLSWEHRAEGLRLRKAPAP